MTGKSTEFVVVERGTLTDDEIAALVAVLASMSSAPEPTTEPPRSAGWRRLERRNGFGAAHSWQHR